MLSNELCKMSCRGCRRSFQEGWYEERGCPSHLEDLTYVYGVLQGRNGPLLRGREIESQSPFFQPSGWAGVLRKFLINPGACPGNRMMNPDAGSPAGPLKLAGRAGPQADAE